SQALVMSGVVLADEKRIEKPSEMVSFESIVRIKDAGPAAKYVGRGGLKLEKALNAFHIRPHGYDCLDVGSSTGGFTDCLLQNGARTVTAVDAGTNQLAWKIRTDPRVTVHENTNARRLGPEVGGPFDLIVMDVSFISVRLIIPGLIQLMTPEGKLIVLIKPQFEVGKGEVGKGGIVRDDSARDRVVAEINTFASDSGLEVVGVIDSPILGSEGNKEFLALYETRHRPTGESPNGPLVEGKDYYFENGLMVLSAAFLERRGYCCKNGCRHCPYPQVDEAQSRNSSNSL
ncbi:MAG: TlyA family rRNA (cytidine-2'-O)-methyltransferase, partial [Acidobacteriota bacterium]